MTHYSICFFLKMNKIIKKFLPVKTMKIWLSIKNVIIVVGILKWYWMGCGFFFIFNVRLKGKREIVWNFRATGERLIKPNRFALYWNISHAFPSRASPTPSPSHTLPLTQILRPSIVYHWANAVQYSFFKIRPGLSLSFFNRDDKAHLK